MARFVSADVSGTKEVVARLHGLKLGLRNKVLRPAMNDALKPVQAAVKAKAAHNSGLLERSIGRKVVGDRKSGAVTGLVGPRSDMARTVTHADGSIVLEDPARVAHLVEFGRREVVAGGTGAILSAGGDTSYGTRAAAAAAQPFLRPGWEQSKGAAVEALAQRVQRGIADLVRSGKA